MTRAVRCHHELQLAHESVDLTALHTVLKVVAVGGCNADALRWFVTDVVWE